MVMDINQVRRQLREYADDGAVSLDEMRDLRDTIGDDQIRLNDGSVVRLSELLRSGEFRNLVQAGTPLQPAEFAEENLQNLRGQLQPLAEELDALRRELDNLRVQFEEERTEALKNRINESEARVAFLQGRMQGLLQRAVRIPGGEEFDSAWFRAADMPAPGEEGRGSGEFQFMMGPGKAMTSGGQGGGAGARAQTAAPFTMPPLWGAQTIGPEFSSDAFLKSQAIDDYAMSSFEDVLKNQNRGRQLMMLFHYFAQRAASGDLGQMYQFMKFLTYIISKDKAKQQIDMGKKLIELQDESRRVTDVLMNTKSNAADPNANNEFMKTMTWAKSQSDAVATSQKLIGQMMEEFAQIVETLVNVTKGALEVHGRVLRTVAPMRG